MKIFLIVISLLIIVNSIKASEEDDKQNEITSIIEKIKSPQPYIKEIVEKSEANYNISNQFNNSCPNILKDLLTSINSAIECGNNINPNLTVCAAWRTHFLPCVAPIVTVIDNCLPQKAKGTPNLFAKAIDSGIKYTCNLSGEQIFEFLNDCIVPTEKNENDLKTLLDNVGPIVRNFDKKIDDLSVQDICSYEDNIRKQIAVYVNKSCVNQFTRNVFNGFVDALYAPCTENN